MALSYGDEKILSHNDVVLRRSDLDILGGPHYINDRIIEFYFARLSSSLPATVLLVPPSISFWVSNCPDQQSLREAVDPLEFRNKDLVLFTVNNNTDVTVAEGGTHWSLLVYERRTNTFVHHDSSRGMNGWHARRLYEAVKGFVSEVGSRFMEGFTPQQENGYDCGLYVMAIARVACSWYENGSQTEGEGWSSALEEVVSAEAVANLRVEVLRLILSLMNQK